MLVIDILAVLDLEKKINGIIEYEFIHDRYMYSILQNSKTLYVLEKYNILM